MNPFAASRPVHLSGRVNVQVLRPLLPFATLKSVQSSIATYLERQGRRRQVSRGDGNCLFRSFSFQLTGNQDNHISVRTLLLRFENLNRSEFQPYLTPINCSTMAEHVSHVQKPDVFGTHLEILAIATYYNVPVYYCQPLRGQYSWHCVEPIKSTGEQSFRVPDISGSPLEDIQPPSHFELSYTLNTHYDSIVSVTGEVCRELPRLNSEEVYVSDVL